MNENNVIKDFNIEIDKQVILPQLKKITIVPTLKEQTYKPDTSFGYGEITVQGEPNLKPENISERVSIFGVQGQYTPDAVFDFTKKTSSSINSAAIELNKVDCSKWTSLSQQFWADNGYQYNLRKIKFINTSNITNIYEVVYYDSALTDFYFEDSSNVQNFGSALQATGIEKSYPFDFSSATTIDRLYCSCNNLKEIGDISGGPALQNMEYLAAFCPNLETVGLIDMGTVRKFYYAFHSCSKLKNLKGFLNYGKSANNDALYLKDSPLLTHESLLNVFNNLYDLKANGISSKPIWIGSINLAKLTAEEIAIATNKGWTVS